MNVFNLLRGKKEILATENSSETAPEEPLDLIDQDYSAYDEDFTIISKDDTAMDVASSSDTSGLSSTRTQSIGSFEDISPPAKPNGLLQEPVDPSIQHRPPHEYFKNFNKGENPTSELLPKADSTADNFRTQEELYRYNGLKKHAKIYAKDRNDYDKMMQDQLKCSRFRCYYYDEMKQQLILRGIHDQRAHAAVETAKKANHYINFKSQAFGNLISLCLKDQQQSAGFLARKKKRGHTAKKVTAFN